MGVALMGVLRLLNVVSFSRAVLMGKEAMLGPILKTKYVSIVG
jgi:hypothetical protein